MQSPAEYVAHAAGLAGDLDALDRLHRGLRGRMERSAVMDQEGYMRALEQAYEHALARWSEGERA